jgi:hypothetical protein
MFDQCVNEMRRVTRADIRRFKILYLSLLFLIILI